MYVRTVGGDAKGGWMYANCLGLERATLCLTEECSSGLSEARSGRAAARTDQCGTEVVQSTALVDEQKGNVS